MAITSGKASGIHINGGPTEYPKANPARKNSVTEMTIPTADMGAPYDG